MYLPVSKVVSEQPIDITGDCLPLTYDKPVHRLLRTFQVPLPDDEVTVTVKDIDSGVEILVSNHYPGRHCKKVALH